MGVAFTVEAGEENVLNGVLGVFGVSGTDLPDPPFCKYRMTS